MTEAVTGSHSIVNAVSLYTQTRRDRFDDVHHLGAGRLARAAREAGSERLVHISGIGADPSSAAPYVAARGLGEIAARAGFPKATILRPSVIVGPGDAFLQTLEWVTRLPVIPLFGNGATRLQPTHADDVASAVAAAIAAGTPVHGTLELGGVDILSYRRIVEHVLEHVGRRRPLLPIPFPLWHALARIASPLPSPPITHDQLELLARDNVAAGPGFEVLGLEPRGLRACLPQCLPGADSSIRGASGR